MYYLQEKNSIVFKNYLKTCLSGKKVEGEMMPQAEGSSVKEPAELDLWPLG